MSQEIVENDLDLQTDPENHLHLAPTSALPVSLTLSPPTVMNGLPISLYSHTLCGGAPRHLDPKYWHVLVPPTASASAVRELG